MSDGKYVRPNIARAIISNPEREGSTKTELEQEVTRIARAGTPQVRKQFNLVHYQYDAPFFYENFRLELGRPWENATNHAIEDVPEDEWGIMTPELTPLIINS